MIRALPIIVGVLPLIGVFAAYWLNVRADLLPSCMPFLDGCTSISATGRYMPGSMPFRAALLPQAAFLSIFWWLSTEWLRSVSPTARNRTVIRISGVVGATALVLYVSFLGTKQPFYEFMRHFGIYVYFLGTVLSQALLTLSMPRSRMRSAMLWVIGTPFGLGLLNVAQKMLLGEPNNIQNRIEWIVALLMQIWFVLLYFAWRKTGFELTVRTDRTSVRS